ncbi:MAG: glycosyltransferase family 2 protein [Lachnoanaerobaculum sp.]|nr:glycosyltransferase family 2 protein [Lachnoanaerobaculum sp.]
MIEILLATYNGERFLPEQIESITSQSFKDYNILASDDNSSDCTFEILRSYESVLGEKIKVVQSNTHSAKENFYNLLDMADDEYIALCDQDDFWESDRLEKSLKALQRLEKRYGKETPILVHSDLEIVDGNLNSQNKKMSELTGISEAIKYAKKESKYLYTISTEKSFSRYLVENNITGNTVIINKALLDIYKRPKVSFMHDWWLGLIAFTFGKVGFLNECLVKYRQHESNELGAKNPLELRNIKKRNKQKIRENYDCMFAQVEEFLRLYKDELGKSRSADTYFARKYLNAFANMKSKNRISKIRDILKYSFFKSSKILTIGEMLNI